MNTNANPNTPARPVVLLTDFGLHDAYVGIMKGVLLRLCAAAPLIDLTHAIEPQNVTQAAYVLWSAYRYFPADAVFLVVVDPGVGSARQPVAVESGTRHFVGPDNGVFSEALADLGAWEAVQISAAVNPHPVLSATFHGRDLFAPAAARLACGEALHSLGPRQDALVMRPLPAMQINGNTISGEVLHVDHFGSAITNIGPLLWETAHTLRLHPRAPEAKPLLVHAGRVNVQVGRRVFARIARTYADVPGGEAAALVGSSGMLEIAVNGGSAALALGLAPGARVTLRLDH